MPKTLVDSQTDIVPKKERKPRAKKPASLSEVTFLVNSLSLQDKATLCTYLKNEIKSELTKIQDQAKAAEQIVNGI